MYKLNYSDTGEPPVEGFSVVLFTNKICNYKCNYCIGWADESDEVTFHTKEYYLELIGKIFDVVEASGRKYLFMSMQGGESFVNPYILEMIEEVVKQTLARGLTTRLGFITNLSMDMPFLRNLMDKYQGEWKTPAFTLDFHASLHTIALKTDEDVDAFIERVMYLHSHKTTVTSSIIALNDSPENYAFAVKSMNKCYDAGIPIRFCKDVRTRFPYSEEQEETLRECALRTARVAKRNSFEFSPRYAQNPEMLLRANRKTWFIRSEDGRDVEGEFVFRGRQVSKGGFSAMRPSHFEGITCNAGYTSIHVIADTGQAHSMRHPCHVSLGNIMKGTLKMFDGPKLCTYDKLGTGVSCYEKSARLVDRFIPEEEIENAKRGQV